MAEVAAPTSAGLQRRYQGALSHFEEALRIDARGLALLEELVAGVRHRDEQGYDPEAVHAIAAEEIEPIFATLQEVAADAVKTAEALHKEISLASRPASKDLTRGTSGSFDDPWAVMKLADFLEQDAQFKIELINGLTHGSNAAEVMAAQVFWGTKPWLGHKALGLLPKNPER
eukprot:TRINITY_DN68610_c0_g1_i1.p2 TRINITY_DN68610_c0_g1~~TRINITY_DN68610_c0_g1_i1.p2  ORF type:complete len:173 (-),score=31.71 TRINITY_DN68610_c0_g1_i1:185-703(-)